MSFTKISLTLREVEYSCSPGGVDTWELYSLSENLLKSSEKFEEITQYVMDNFSGYEIDLNIKSLSWWNKEQNYLEEEEANEVRFN